MKIIKKIEDYAVIYLRYLNNQLLYIGESQSFIKSRHCREDNSIGDFDLIKILKAPKNVQRRRYWEAYLICKLKPIKQRPELYRYLVEKTNGREFKKTTHKLILLEERLIDKKELLFHACLNLERFKEYMNFYRKLK